jgi:vacuolar-type H+-ATPase subunit C/Vma6
MPRTKTKKIQTEKFESLEVADGQKEVQNNALKEAKNIEEILRASKKLRIEQSQEEYEEYITALSMAELQDHAYQKRLLPIGNRKKLESLLVQEFIRERIYAKSARPLVDPFAEYRKSPEKYKALQDILNKDKR